MKNDYLNELRDILENHHVSEKDIDEILSDYTLLYDEGVNKSMSEKEIRDLLGEPKNVYQDLKDTLTYVYKNRNKHKFVALSPFIAVFTFMLIGLTTQTWHPTWLIFLLIPMSGVISGRTRHVIVGLSPFLALIAFFVLLEFDIERQFAWLVFLFVPLSGSLTKRSAKSYLIGLSIIAAIVAYLYLQIYTEFGQLSYLVFLLPIVVSISSGNISISTNLGDKPFSMGFFTLLYVIAFLFIGFYFEGWAYGWQVLLLIPVTAIIISGKFRWVAVMPFIATIIFFSLGHFFGLFYISWLAFLLIPVSGILSKEHETVKITKNSRY